MGLACKMQCSWEGTYADLVAKHLLQCEFHRVPCPHGCGEMIERRGLQEHEVVCNKSFEECSICGSRVRKGAMEAHRKENAELHVQLLEGKLAEVEQPTKQLQKIKESLADMATKIEESVAVCTQVKNDMAVLERANASITDLVEKERRRSMVKWVITDVANLLRECPKGKCRRSPSFGLAGMDGFSICYFPKGSSTSPHGQAACFLHVVDKLRHVRVAFELSVDGVQKSQSNEISFPSSLGLGWSDAWNSPKSGASEVKIQLQLLSHQTVLTSEP